MSKNKLIVNVSDAKVSSNPADVLITYSLGSCIAVTLYDPVTHASGMLHYQLPSSNMDPERAKKKPFMYADSGMKMLMEKLVSMGAKKNRLQVKIAGGAEMAVGPKGFEIGKRNHLAIRKIMWGNAMLIDTEDVGGNSPRNMYINVANGDVIVKSNGLEKRL